MNNLHLLSSNTRLSYTLYCRPEYPQANKKSKIHYNYLIALKSHVTFLLLLSVYVFNILNSSSKSSHSLFYTFSKINQFTVSMTAIPDTHIRFSPSPKPRKLKIRNRIICGMELFPQLLLNLY